MQLQTSTLARTIQACSECCRISLLYCAIYCWLFWHSANPWNKLNHYMVSSRNRGLAGLQVKDYWQLSTSERLALLKALVHIVSDTVTVREQIQDSGSELLNESLSRGLPLGVDDTGTCYYQLASDSGTPILGHLCIMAIKLKRTYSSSSSCTMRRSSLPDFQLLRQSCRHFNTCESRPKLQDPSRSDEMGFEKQRSCQAPNPGTS